MSSLRNSLHRRNHKERSQLSHRAKFGILEKHKDYVLRARDYHSKQDRIQRLRQKAADRNKDEFYFGMVRQKTQGGVHVQDRGNEALPEDMVKILKSQDENYIRTMRSAGLKKIEKLKGQLTTLADLVAPNLLKGDEDENEDEDNMNEGELETLRQAGIIQAGKSSKNKPKRSSKHFIFVDNADEAKAYAERASNKHTKSDLPSSLSISNGDDLTDLGWITTTTPKTSRKGKGKASGEDGDDKALEAAERREAAKKHRTRLLKELSARLIRDQQLRYAERELAMQRMLMGRGGRMKLRDVEKVEGEEKDEDMDEDELDSIRVKKSDRIKEKKNQAYKPRVYKWRLERKK